ncbi:V-type ATP synthase subunit F [Nocardia sp. alder85J]|uniref:V-type ATP synthase subunit F n=1 Tax=Nocardia sp. alder85J TaxID=2862949 RepID=UPI001CD1E7DE|nr:V-type ATP synthase subunit F [Nocardia sp. alder85J]MCX4092454.1 V-type ATP synthase subunit F [Nocardia sp. alder85J]
MGGITVIGEPERVSGYGLAGVTVRGASDPDAVRRAWSELDPGTALVILTPAAAAQLSAETATATLLTVVMP